LHIEAVKGVQPMILEGDLQVRSLMRRITDLARERHKGSAVGVVEGLTRYCPWL
jgi:hypothetical protein